MASMYIITTTTKKLVDLKTRNANCKGFWRNNVGIVVYIFIIVTIFTHHDFEKKWNLSPNVECWRKINDLPMVLRLSTFYILYIHITNSLWQFTQICIYPLIFPYRFIYFIFFFFYFLLSLVCVIISAWFSIHLKICIEQRIKHDVACGHINRESVYMYIYK